MKRFELWQVILGLAVFWAIFGPMIPLLFKAR